MVKIEEEEWDLEVTPERGLFELPLKDIWHFRDLLVLMVRRDFVSFYKQTILGPMWFFIQPVFTTVVFVFVFGNLAGLSTDGLPQFLFYLAGITAWNYFADCLIKTSTVFRDNAQLFGKVYFPRLVVPISIVIGNLIRFGVQFLLFMGVWFYFFVQGSEIYLTWAALFFPLLLALMAFLGLGLGLMITAMTTKYRDLAFLVNFGVQLLMYATTVIYPLSSAPDKYKHLVALNPMTGIIETFRYAFLGEGMFSWTLLGYSAFVAIVSMILGILIFNKTEKNFIDTV
ncbi:ABC transporter permease [Cecembia lonarensis]|uniref:Transport permease protein n=1 Tax=Cecembia lonarensis (strain CCUG 58316 / KCTC 22772 / LW9) TaxID=1225176 RepID=K1L1T9_CECL9|nr:ABC transporter permease [Cecembia lonarensis]EKB48721.1 ABC-2 type transporter [Cecembia lonarensis LW9]